MFQRYASYTKFKNKIKNGKFAILDILFRITGETFETTVFRKTH